MKKILFTLILFLNPNMLYCLDLKGDFFQGNLIIGKTEPDSKIFIDEKRVKISKKGFFAFGLGKDRKNNVTIIEFKNGVSKKIVKKLRNTVLID